MKKGLRVLSMSLLLSSLFVTGCSCSKEEKTNVSRINDSENKLLNGLSADTSDYSLLDLYNTLIANGVGNTKVANKLVELVANEVLDIGNVNSVWKTRYDNLVKEKLQQLAESSTYLVKGKFSEQYFVEALKSEGYNITCPADVNYGTPSTLACDYSAYINNNIKVEVLSTLLKEKYIQDEVLPERSNLLTNKKIRDVEYITLNSSLDSDYDDLNVRDFIRGIRDEIAQGKVVKFSGENSVESRFKDKLKEIINTERDKIGTSSDYSQAIFAEYTNNYTQSIDDGYNAKIKTIDDSEYVFSKIIGSDSESTAIVSEAITSTLLSINNPSDDEFKRKVVTVTDEAGNTYYYLVNANAGTVVDESDILLSETSDASTYTYSIVRFRVINSSTTDDIDVYNAIKLLASESTLASGALLHYIETKKETISVYDDEFKAYLETLYPDVFAD